jgi:iron complex transport system substrate-binding protein
MRAKWTLAAVLAAIFVASFAAKVLLNRAKPTVESEGDCRRIVSTSPSTTETLFALGLGDRVVGVSRYCLYPPEAQSRTIVGGYLDPNYEAILALEPDLVVLRGENQEFVTSFQRLGLPTLVVRHDNIEGILDSIVAIGDRCGAAERGRDLAGELRAEMERIEAKNRGRPRPRVLVAAERTLGSGKIANVYVTGADGFYNRMIELAGGQNACPDRSGGFPVVSAEGVLKMNPEVIVELISKERQKGLTREEIVADWKQLPHVDAVRNGRIYIVDDDFAFIPGPRFIRLVENLDRLLHPDGGKP